MMIWPSLTSSSPSPPKFVAFQPASDLPSKSDSHFSLAASAAGAAFWPWANSGALESDSAARIAIVRVMAVLRNCGGNELQHTRRSAAEFQPDGCPPPAKRAAQLQ